MAKRLFLLLICSIISIIHAPGFLMATDTVEVSRVNTSKVVETVIPEPEPEPEPEPAPAPVQIQTPATPAAPAAGTAPQLVNYTVTSVTDTIVEYPSNWDIYRTGKFIYAHNSTNLLGNLVSLNPGSTFTITEGGATRTYQVMAKNIYEKAANGYLNGSRQVTKDVEIHAGGYDVALMTCHGTSYGNGDASHRLVIFANAV